jgi:hypothetical protein
VSRVYAVDENGERFLRHLECDKCSKKIKPRPDIACSGWTKRGEIVNGELSEWHYCEVCS